MTSSTGRTRQSRPTRRAGLGGPRTLAAAVVGGLALVLTATTAAPASALPTPGTSGRTVRPTTTLTHRTVTGVWSRKAPRPTPVRGTAADLAALEVLRLVNVERARVGCSAVRWEARLATAARLHSEDMARQNYFSHTSLDGRTPWDRIRAQGYTYGSAENIAAGFSTPATVMVAWMNSPGHRTNILNCTNKALGVGSGKGGDYGIYWTQDFGSR